MHLRTTHSPYTTYRPDIDGMRAIAVLSVVGYHAFPSNIRGGFIGVDMFFVISGYLITTILCTSLRDGTFSYKGFYSRRIRRIFPALALVLAASYLLGWRVLLADEYTQLGAHIAAGAGFVANFLLWNEQGYFDNARDTKPLMHLWSLGIEEQFYLLWPLVLSYAWKWRLPVLSIAILLAGISFALNVAGITHDPVGTFYSPQTRWWELMIGATLSHVIHYRPPALARLHTCLDRYLGRITCAPVPEANGYTLRNILSLMGAALTCGGLLLITDDDTFPGWWALLPTLGVAALISAGPEAWVNRAVLSNRLLVWIGLISYPLYLWHWPLLSFTRIIGGQVPSIAVRAAAVLDAFLLAGLTYYLFERPIRFGRYGSAKTAVLILCMVAIGLTGYACYKNNGYELRPANTGPQFNSKQLSWVKMSGHDCVTLMNMPAPYCLIVGNPRALTLAILGDSTANALAPGLMHLYGTDRTGVIHIGQWGCPPITGVRGTPNCMRLVKRAYDVVLGDPSIKTVMLSIFIRDLQGWGLPGVPNNANVVEKFEFAKLLLDSDIEDLKKHGKRVILTFDTPQFPFDARDCIRSLPAGTRCTIPERGLIARQPYLALFSQYYGKREDICVFWQSPFVSRNGVFSMVDPDGRLLYRDDHHLGMFGSLMMAQALQHSKCAP